MGTIWLKELIVGDSTFDPSIAVATYDAGAKLAMGVSRLIRPPQADANWQPDGERHQGATAEKDSKGLDDVSQTNFMFHKERLTRREA